MKKFKRILRLISLILFMALALTGIGLLGVAPPLTKDGKLLPGIEVITEVDDEQLDEKQKN